MGEKRRSLRKKRRFLVKFEAANSIGTGFTYDMSPTGIFVRSARIPRLGSPVQAQLELPGGHKLPLQGNVVRTFRAPAALSAHIPSGFGLRLSEIPEEYVQFLATL